MNRQVHVIGGGTVFHIRPHLALSAPAYGKTAWDIVNEVSGHPTFEGEVHLYTTRMAGDDYQGHAVGKKGTLQFLARRDNIPRLETNEDIAKLLDQLCKDPEPKIIFLPAALCDYEVESCTSDHAGDGVGRVGKDLPRLKTGERHHDGRPVKYEVILSPAEKVIQRVRKTRKDIYLVGFKTTTGAEPQEMFESGLKLLKQASCNLVLANDLHTKLNIIITPEQAPYSPTKDRGVAIATLVDMALSRAQGHFTRTVEAVGLPVNWRSDGVPFSLRAVVDFCVSRGAYKPFLGSTVGHFAFKFEEGKFITSRRKTDFNQLRDVGMVVVEAIDDTQVIAYGGKPSVGGQSQRIIFRDHPEMDCIVHFHCPLKPGVAFPTASQYYHECGSHECGKNTSQWLQTFKTDKGSTVKAIMLDKHGPNIVFNRDIDPTEVMRFIDEHWDLSRSTSEILL